MRLVLRHVALPAAIALTAGMLVGQYFGPQVYSVANSASYATSGRNGYGIAQGSLFVIFGQNLGPAQLQQAQSFPLPTSLAGTSVQITMGGSSWDAIMIYTYSAQVAAILPSAVPAGVGSLSLTYNGQPSRPIPITVSSSGFGVYSASSNGLGAGIITRPDYQLTSLANPARPGDTLIIWGTGLGPVSGDEAGGALPGNRFPGTEVFVGGQSANVPYAGRSGCCAGLDQIVFQVPSPASEGCFVPVAVRTGGVVSNFTTLPIASGGGSCADPMGIPADLITKAEAGKAVAVGAVAVGPVPILQSAGFSFLGGITEQFSKLVHARVPSTEVKQILEASGPQRLQMVKSAARRYSHGRKATKSELRAVVRLAAGLHDAGAAGAFTQLLGLKSLVAQFGSLLPPAGACTTAKSWSFNPQQWDVSNQPRDAGTQMVLTSPFGTQILTKVHDGEYQVRVGSGFADYRLPSGVYTISAQGGPDVGAFSNSLASGSLLWTNKDSVTVVDRSRPLTVTWGANNTSGYVIFGGVSSSDGDGTAFACVEAAQKQTLTVPQFILNAMPAAVADRGLLFLAAHPLQNAFTASGLDAAYFIDLSSDYKRLAYQ
ncbi:MAG: hypothetical protein U0Q18_30185 [Bryobacteraceae bacterium]